MVGVDAVLTCSPVPQLSPSPAFIAERLALYERLKTESDALLARRAATDARPITVALPDGRTVEGVAWTSTPYQLACGVR